MDFSPLLSTGELIQSISVVDQFEWDENTEDWIVSTDLTLGTAATDGTYAQVRISGGVDQKTYKISFLLVTDAGNELEGDGILTLVDQ